MNTADRIAMIRKAAEEAVTFVDSSRTRYWLLGVGEESFNCENAEGEEFVIEFWEVADEEYFEVLTKLEMN